MRTGFIIFAHGSRIESANDAVRSVARQMAQAGGYDLVDVAFLDCSAPDLATTVGRLVQRGADRIVVIPYFLTLGRHAAEDLPRIAEEASRVHENVRIEITAPMEGHPTLADVLLERAREALS